MFIHILPLFLVAVLSFAPLWPVAATPPIQQGTHAPSSLSEPFATRLHLPLVTLQLAPFTCSLVTEIPQQECEALVDLYQGTNGDGWRVDAGWLQTITPCSWQGITCAAGGVEMVSLEGNGLKGAIPANLGNLTNLRFLYLSENQLDGSIPAELGTLIHLQELGLGQNQLSGPIPPQLGSLINLERLSIYGNQLAGPIPPELGNLTNLKFVNLSANQLNGPMPSQLTALTNLQELVVSDNQLAGSLPSELGRLTKLEWIDLRQTLLSGPLPLSLTNLKSLRFFWFDSTQLCEPNDTTFQTWLASIFDVGSTNTKCGRTW